MTNQRIPVIDLFAGPGGLGEGFSSFAKTGLTQFKIALSVEKCPDAHQTLELRSFFRQFDTEDVPDDYYAFLRQEITRSQLFERYPEAAETARNEALLATLGEIDEGKLDTCIAEALKGREEEWVLIGGPPCQAYSIVGRARNRGIEAYRPETDRRHFLYREYLRIIAKHWPSLFVMENVKGILSSRVNGHMIFHRIENDLRNPGRALGVEERYQYRIFSLVPAGDGRSSARSDQYVIKCEDYGIPQARHRVILLGVRCSPELDGQQPGVLRFGERATVRDILSGLPKVRSGLTCASGRANWIAALAEIETSAWMRGVSPDLRSFIEARLRELRDTEHALPEIGSAFMRQEAEVSDRFKSWYLDTRIGGVCNHVCRGHMASDLHRYFYAACYAAYHGASPMLADFPEELLPKHKNVSQAVETNRLFSDRFRVQTWERPATTVTCHIAKDGHYYIHPDPLQCRSLSVREAARLQTFPDNYYFCGSRTAQYTQVGNAVPPLLANQIAEIVASLLSTTRRKEHV